MPDSNPGPLPQKSSATKVATTSPNTNIINLLTFADYTLYNIINLNSFRFAEAIFTISVSGSSCNCLFFGLILLSIAFSIYSMISPRQDGMPRETKRERRENETTNERFT